MLTEICLKDILLESAKDVFETMIFMELTENTEPGNSMEEPTMLGLITFKGSIEGCLAICCTMPCIQNVTMNMLGMDSAEQATEEDVCDAIGEVANMIVGGVKKRLLDSVGNLDISIPSVVRGREVKNNLGDSAKNISVNINIEGQYSAELSMLYRRSL